MPDDGAMSTSVVVVVVMGIILSVVGITLAVGVMVVVVAMVVVVGSAIIVGVCTAAGVNALSAFTNTGEIDSITVSPFTPLDVISGSSMVSSTVVVLLLLPIVDDDEDNNELEDVITSSSSSSSPTDVSSWIIAEEEVGTSFETVLTTVEGAIDFSGGLVVVVVVFAVTGNTATAPTSNA